MPCGGMDSPLTGNKASVLCRDEVVGLTEVFFNPFSLIEAGGFNHAGDSVTLLGVGFGAVGVGVPLPGRPRPSFVMVGVRIISDLIRIISTPNLLDPVQFVLSRYWEGL